MMKAGLENKPMVFLFSDTQIKAESFLEDLNNILNAGDVPNIYAFDDLESIYTSMKPICQDMGLQPTKTNLFSLYTKNVRSNLHTVITMRSVYAWGHNALYNVISNYDFSKIRLSNQIHILSNNIFPYTV
jgi:dynein heavy chain